MDSHVDINTFTQFKSNLPVSKTDEVESFGISVLGLEYHDVRRIIHSKQERPEPSKVAADLLQRWLEHKPNFTAQELLNAMRISHFSKRNVDAFENFLKTQKYTKGTLTSLYDQ